MTVNKARDLSQNSTNWEENVTAGFKWDSMYSDILTFSHKRKICQIRAENLGEII